MKFKQIETFRVVMLTRSMTLAAKELHTTQPNISRFIAQLEAETGLRLFDRKAGRLNPTAEGEAFYQEVQRSFLGMDALEDSVRLIRTLGTGSLRVGAVPSIAMSVMPKVIQAFRERYPDTPVSIHTNDSPTVAKWTATRYCDLGLVSYLVDTAGVESHILAEEAGVAIVPVGHRLAKKRSVSPSDFDDEPFISLTQGDGTRVAVDAAFAPDKRKLILDTPYAPTICRMVEMGLGVSVVNPLVVRNMSLPGIKALPFTPTVPFARYVVVAQQRTESAQMTAFMDCLATA
ncbi:MAG: LysR family transcriptional regulator [Acidovorax sp.]|uniref:LysR family transcriptional regulator n=1 Tax=Acidovorax sp. TaxID=1872122 RepID=UPI0022BFFC32|nr:LysR family transcriptional regulator [Acidovorax sp.]MCZ8220044.1 LysR family transcriptional regulator [Acidovorax sp.]